MANSKPRLSWRKEPNEIGLARVCQGERGFELRRGKEILVNVAPLERFGASTWYWYGLGINTFADNLTFATADEAKADATRHVREKEARNVR